jgi:hypothetical protein
MRIFGSTHPLDWPRTDATRHPLSAGAGLCLPDYRGRLDIDDDRALDIDKYPNR